MGNLAPSSSLSLSFSFSSRAATGSRFSFSLSAATTFSLFSFSRRAQSSFLPSFPSQEHLFLSLFPLEKEKREERKISRERERRKEPRFKKPSSTPAPSNYHPYPSHLHVQHRVPFVQYDHARHSSWLQRPARRRRRGRACSREALLRCRRGARRLRFPLVPRSEREEPVRRRPRSAAAAALTAFVSLLFRARSASSRLRRRRRRSVVVVVPPPNPAKTLAVASANATIIGRVRPDALSTAARPPPSSAGSLAANALESLASDASLCWNE
jgi:hypothetical protein